MNVYIGEPIIVGDYTAMQGPAPDGFYVPSYTEWAGLRDIMKNNLSLTTGDSWRINLHIPFAGTLKYDRGTPYWQGRVADLRMSNAIGNYAKFLQFSSSEDPIMSNGRPKAWGYSVRCFKNSYAFPDSTWTVIQGTLGSAGIFWNQAKGLISITNGTTGYTMMDKNLGATIVYNDGDTLSEANCGKYYQWGNNYGFPRTGSVTTSSTTVNTNNYGPGNYYSSSTFITGGSPDYDWSSVQNNNLRGGVTGVVQKTVSQELKNAYIGEVIECDFTQSDCGFTFAGSNGNQQSYGRGSNGLYVVGISSNASVVTWKIPSNIYSKGVPTKIEMVFNGTATKDGGGIGNATGNSAPSDGETGVGNRRDMLYGTYQGSKTTVSSTNPANKDYTFTIDFSTNKLSNSENSNTYSMSSNIVNRLKSDFSSGKLNIYCLCTNGGGTAYIKKATFYF